MDGLQVLRTKDPALRRSGLSEMIVPLGRTIKIVLSGGSGVTFKVSYTPPQDLCIKKSPPADPPMANNDPAHPAPVKFRSTALHSNSGLRQHHHHRPHKHNAPRQHEMIKLQRRIFRVMVPSSHDSHTSAPRRGGQRQYETLDCQMATCRGAQQLLTDQPPAVAIPRKPEATPPSQSLHRDADTAHCHVS